MRKNLLYALLPAAAAISLAFIGGSTEIDASNLECRDPAPELLEQITANNDRKLRVTPVDAQAVQIPESGDYYTAMRFGLVGTNEVLTGVWKTNSLESGPTTITSVDSYAREFTRWPASGGIGATNEYVHAAVSCLSNPR